mmetsp:Transcript_7640/g.14253  ORF Transcript_7640/g.14253 Transcript_7640/m.14253 type:complete len:369 (-) Transcript_7640:49-1155(-)
MPGTVRRQGAQTLLQTPKRKRLKAVITEDPPPPPSSREFALHEVVGWLLGATFAMFDSQSISKVPELLAEYRHAEMDLLRAVISKYVGRGSSQHVHQMMEPAPLVEQSVFIDLLRGLQSYCSDDGESGTEEKWWISAASSAWLSNAFYARVTDIVERRSLWHAERGASKQSCGAGRSIRSRQNARRKLSSTVCTMTVSDGQAPLATDAETVNGTQRNCCDTDKKPQKPHEPPKSDTMATVASPCLQSQNCNGQGQKPKRPEAKRVTVDARSAGLDVDPPQECQSAAKDSNGKRDNLIQNTGEDEEWPEGNGSCEGCGRITYGCEAWSNACVILCNRCRKARSPMWWALANEAFRMQSAIPPAAVLGGA